MKKGTSKNLTTKKSAPERAEDYLAAIPEAAWNALENLWNTIKIIVHKAVEDISYKIPTFRYNVQMLVASEVETTVFLACGI